LSSYFKNIEKFGGDSLDICNILLYIHHIKALYRTCSPLQDFQPFTGLSALDRIGENARN
jgi:hypothetical protein